MNISIISFTRNGMLLSRKLAKILIGDETTLFTKCKEAFGAEPMQDVQFVEKSIGEWADEQMKEKNCLLFIGACGIAVRAIAPYLTDKLHDSPVLVMDEKGNYVIPILSGHMGGANELACSIANKMEAIPVITTATDLNERFAVDLFAKKNRLAIVDKDGIAKVSSKVLAGEEITMSIENGYIQKNNHLPTGIRLVCYPPTSKVDIVITSQKEEFDATLCLKPKVFVIGMGCKKGVEEEKIEEFILHSLEELGISTLQLFAIASIQHKSGEPGFIKWSKKAGVPFITYSAEELQSIEGSFHGSAFVQRTVGVDNVCERAALKACRNGGYLIYEKHAQNGMTIAVAEREWSVEFDEA